MEVYLAFPPVWRYSTQIYNYIRYKWVKKKVKGLTPQLEMSNKTIFNMAFVWCEELHVCRSQRMLSTCTFTGW